MPKEETNEIQMELERRILHGLVCEWELAAAELGLRGQRNLRKPTFSLHEMKSLGRWYRDRREISLSRGLVLNHPWDAVREVLVHEIAHQAADELLTGKLEPPHGPSFQHACRLLRANPKASGRYRPLDERIRQQTSPGDKIMARIRKLMALAASENQHEAELAMSKAHEMIKKHNVDRLQTQDRQDFCSVFLGKPALRRFREEYRLATLISDFYFIYAIWAPAYVVDKGRMGRVLEITGALQNVKIASYVHDFVRRFIDTQWREYNSTRSLNRYRKTDFAEGILEGFRSKLQSQLHKGSPEHELAIVSLRDHQLDEYVRYKYPRVSRFNRKVWRHGGRVLADGREIGKRLNISKAVEEKGSPGKLLVEG